MRPFHAGTETETETKTRNTDTQEKGNSVRSMRVSGLVTVGVLILSRRVLLAKDLRRARLVSAATRAFLRSSLQDGPWNMEQRGLGFWFLVLGFFFLVFDS